MEGEIDIFQQLVDDIKSIKQVNMTRQAELDICNGELQNKKNDLEAAHRKIAVLEHEGKSLRNLIVKEKYHNKTNAKEIKSLKETNDQLKREKIRFANFLSKLGSVVSFKQDDSADKMEILLHHIQASMKASENERRELQRVRKIIETVVQPTISKPSKPSAKKSTDAPKKISTATSQSSQNKSPKSEVKRPKQSPLISSKRNKHAMDMNSSTSTEFRCICGKTYHFEQSLKRHISYFTEKLKFRCTTCNKSFLHKSALNQHFKTAKCVMANLQQEGFDTGDKTLDDSSPTFQPILNCQPGNSKFSRTPISKDVLAKSPLFKQVNDAVIFSGLDIFKINELLKEGFTLKQETESMPFASVKTERSPTI